MIDQDASRPARRFRLELTLVALTVLCVAGFGSRLGWFGALDRLAFDAVVELTPVPVREDIVVIGIDAQTLAAVGRWPWTRARQAELVAALTEREPRLLFADIIYSEPGDPDGDAALIRGFDAPVVTALPVLLDAVSQGGMMVEELPFPELIDVVDLLGHVHVELEEDGIVRGSYMYKGVGSARWPHIGLVMMSELTGAELSTCANSADWSLAAEQCNYRRIRFAGPPGSFPYISALDVLEGRVDRELIAGKVLLLGRTDIGAPDAVPASVSAESRPMAGVEYNANVLNAALEDGLVETAAPWPTLILTLLLVAVALMVLPRLQPRFMLLAAVGFVLLPLVLMVVSVAVFGVSAELASASVGAGLVYPLWSWRRNEMGWRHVGDELDRLAAEAYRWSRSRARLSDEDLPGRVRWLLSRPDDESDDTLRDQISAEDARILDAILNDQLLGGGRSQLSVDPFVARLLRIGNLAEEVRVGREVSIAGLDQMPTGLCVFAANGNVLLANETFRAFTNTELDHSYFVLEALLHLPDVDWEGVVRGVINGGQPAVVETTGHDRVRLLARMARLEVKGYRQPVGMITITDVTDIRLAQERREETLAFVSHDLRSPISSILALVRAPDASWPDVAERIEAYAQRSLMVSEQFVQLSRVENQTLIERYELDIHLVVSSAIDQVYEAAKEQQTSVELHDATMADDAGWVLGNGELLERVFINLLENAIKYSPGGSVVRVEIKETEARVEICVIDQGYGIPAAELDRVFDPYFRSSKPELAAQRGSGLGLRFVRTVVDRHQGKLDIESVVDAGTTICIQLDKSS